MRNGPEQVQERQLIDRVLRGEPMAQRAFYDAHVERIFGLAYRMTGNEASARDCTQLVFIRLFAKLGSFRGEAALSTWVHAVAVSVVLQWRRKTKAHRERETDIEAADDVAAAGCSAFEQVLDETVRRAIDALALRYRTVVVMHDIEGYTHDEIGAALGITVAASKIRLSRARKKRAAGSARGTRGHRHSAAREATAGLAEIVDRDGSVEVQKAAVFALAQRDSPERVDTLIGVARTHANREVVRAAFFWLAESEDPRAIDFFEDVLRN